MSDALPPAGTNLAVLVGTVIREPEVRTLPSGEVLLALELTIRPPGGPTETAPVTWPDPGPDAQAVVAGAEVVVVGRVRRRFFRSGGVTHSRTDVVADAVVPTRRAARARRAVAPVRAVLG